MDTTTAPGHRAFTTNANDHGGVAITMTTLFMTWSILCYIIRLYIRFGIAQTLGLDDLFCSLATVCIVLFVAASAQTNGT